MALRFVFTLLVDSVCKFLITASAYVLMVGSETFSSVVCPSGPFPTILKLSFPTVAIGAVMRSENINYARSIASAIRQQRQEQKAPTPPSSLSSLSSIMNKASLERLEAKLLANEMECTELRKLTEARKRGIPVSLASLDLGCNPENGENDVLLQRLEALVLEKENEYTKVHKLVLEARKRDSTKCVPFLA
jgi:hypothetical protein